MSANKISSLQEYEREKRAMLNRSTPFGCAIMIIVSIAGFFCYWLPYEYPAQAMPAIIRPFWSTYPLMIVIIGVGFIIIRAILKMLGLEKKQEIEKAINAYEVAKKEYAKWKAKTAKESLLKSHETIGIAESVLSDLSEYQDTRKSIDQDYKDVFGGV
jgi:hypothetical protein